MILRVFEHTLFSRLKVQMCRIWNMVIARFPFWGRFSHVLDFLIVTTHFHSSATDCQVLSRIDMTLTSLQSAKVCHTNVFTLFVQWHHIGQVKYAVFLFLATGTLQAFVMLCDPQESATDRQHRFLWRNSGNNFFSSYKSKGLSAVFLFPITTQFVYQVPYSLPPSWKLSPTSLYTRVLHITVHATYLPARHTLNVMRTTSPIF